MLFSGCAFFMAAISAVALSSPMTPARVACHSSSVGLERICVALFAHRADQHRHILRYLGSGVLERPHC